jgi:hypothetical protein
MAETRRAFLSFGLIGAIAAQRSKIAATAKAIDFKPKL